MIRDPFAPKTVLPDTSELYKMYDKYRTEAFDNKVPTSNLVKIEWSTQLTAVAGKCWTHKRHIKLSVYYHEKFPEEVSNTLIHEMIHLLVVGHGPAFHAWLSIIKGRGYVVSRYSSERATPKPKNWTYTCTLCNRSYPKARRLRNGGINHYCSKCGKNGKLTEKEIL